MNCKNCNTKLNDTYKFCHECGAKVITKRLTMTVIFYNVSEQLFNYDNKVFKTFAHLWSHPEKVILDYIKGVRKRYINVIQYFAIALTLTGLQFFILQNFTESPFGTAPSVIDTANPDHIQASKFEEGFSAIAEMITKYYTVFNVISLPVSAFLSWFVYKLHSKTYNFAEHMVINTYYAAQMLIIVAFISVLSGFIGVSYINFSLIASPFYFIYLWFVLKRIYRLEVLESIAYIIVYMFGYFAFYITLSILITIITLSLTP
jgi:hypothetical protein